jgi:hypothetical protein
LSYSSAWQLGKLLAISDTTFNAALMRFRSQVYNTAADLIRKDLSGMEQKAATLQAMATGVKLLNHMSAGKTGQPNRTIGSTNMPTLSVPPALDDPRVAPRFAKAVADTVKYLSLAGDDIYQDLGLAEGPGIKPNNSDWVTIHNWVFDKMYLSGIPAHYLIPDPSFLPAESLRFFHIDNTWLDCLLDGALSVANHLDRDDDKIRAVIKDTLNTYLKTEVVGVAPQIPICGFILRCQLVKVMPDLRITVKWEVPDAVGHERHEVCRYTQLDDETILGLFDRPFEELDSIVLAQPPHQQNFSLGYSLVPGELKVQPRHLYTQADDPNTLAEASWPLFDNPLPVTETNPWFVADGESGCINLKRMAGDLNHLMNLPENQPTGGKYQDNVPNSCEMAMELNNPSYFFTLTPEKRSNTCTARIRNIQVTLPKFEETIPQEQPAGDSTKDAHDTFSGTVDTAGGSPKDTIPVQGISSVSPHQPTKASNDPTPMPANSSNNKGSTAIQPNFTLNIFPDYKRPPPPLQNAFADQDCVPTMNTYYYDLVFSVRRNAPKSGPPLKMKELRIDIPHEGIYKVPNNPYEALLQESYDGPGAHMLSNQRWVPFLNLSDKFISIRLIPRSAGNDVTMIINDTRTVEISFVLREPKIATVNKTFPVSILGQGRPKIPKRALATVFMTEVYATDNGEVRVMTDQWQVVKKDFADPAGEPGS